MSKCKHAEWGWLHWNHHDENDWVPYIRYCYYCKAQLPLGPAQESGEHAASVAVEQRAAALADPTRDMAQFTLAEWGGWCEFEGVSPQNAEWSAGYLARCIATHADEAEGL